MKKLFLTIMVAVFATSCNESVDYEKIDDAYTLKVRYRSVKDTMGGAAAAAKYQEEFLSIWNSMSDDERTEYANYKSYQESLSQRERAIIEEGLRELNN